MNGQLQNRHYIKKSDYWRSRGQANRDKIRMACETSIDLGENQRGIKVTDTINESLT